MGNEMTSGGPGVGRPTDADAVVGRIVAATNAHDLEALVACFADDYRLEQPVHPGRDFRGREQVRRNWGQILGGVPDLCSTLVRKVVDGNVAWCEWDWSGTRADGVAVRMRGVTVLGIRGREVAWARFYMEPVDPDGDDVGSAIHRTMSARPGGLA